MNQVTEERLERLMHSAASTAPVPPHMAGSVIERAGRTRRFRRWAAGGAALAVPVTATVMLQAGPVGATIPAEVRIDLTQDQRPQCGTAGLNSGSPDYDESRFRTPSPMEQAASLADSAGLTVRFAGLRTDVVPTPGVDRTALVVMTDPSGSVRGSFQFYGDEANGWQLVHAMYC